MTEDMIGWHHRLNEHESEQTSGDGKGQGSLVCCSPWGRKESDTTERLNNEQQRVCASMYMNINIYVLQPVRHASVYMRVDMIYITVCISVYTHMSAYVIDISRVTSPTCFLRKLFFCPHRVAYWILALRSETEHGPWKWES